MKKLLNVHSRQSNSFVATAFGAAVTILLIGGYEATHSVADNEAAVVQATQAEAVARMETIVVTARRG